MVARLYKVMIIPSAVEWPHELRVGLIRRTPRSSTGQRRRGGPLCGAFLHRTVESARALLGGDRATCAIDQDYLAADGHNELGTLRESLTRRVCGHIRAHHLEVI